MVLTKNNNFTEDLISVTLENISTVKDDGIYVEHDISIDDQLSARIYIKTNLDGLNEALNSLYSQIALFSVIVAVIMIFIMKSFL